MSSKYSSAAFRGLERNMSVLARSSASAAAPTAPTPMDHIPMVKKLGSWRKDMSGEWEEGRCYCSHRTAGIWPPAQGSSGQLARGPEEEGPKQGETAQSCSELLSHLSEAHLRSWEKHRHTQSNERNGGHLRAFLTPLLSWPVPLSGLLSSHPGSHGGWQVAQLSPSWVGTVSSAVIRGYLLCYPICLPLEFKNLLEQGPHSIHQSPRDCPAGPHSGETDNLSQFLPAANSFLTDYKNGIGCH